MPRKRPLSGAARERLRREAQAAQRQQTPWPPAATSRRDAATTCGWCGGAIDVKPTGRIPKWCSHTCRQRAWEQTRAAESGRSAVTIVERIVTVPAPSGPRRRDWPALLAELAHNLERGHIYPRELPGLARALDQVQRLQQNHPLTARTDHTSCTTRLALAVRRSVVTNERLSRRRAGRL